MTDPGNRSPGRFALQRHLLSRYRDVETAVRDGYKPFYPTGRMGEEIHYTNYRYRRLEQQNVDYSRPGSILYKRTAYGLKAVGVMSRHRDQHIECLHLRRRPCRTACLFGMNTALRPEMRVRSELLVHGKAFRASAKIHMPMPGRDAQWGDRIQLLC